MKSCTRSTGERLLLGVLGCLPLMLPIVAASAPNPKSVASFEVCLESSAAARVCSSKDLSNVVVQCDNGDGTSFFFKHDDLDDPGSPSAEFLESSQEGVFSCPGGEDILAVFVKSGSAKYAGDAIDGLPRGSGAVWSPQACPVDCSEANSADDEDEPEEPDEEPPLF